MDKIVSLGSDLKIRYEDGNFITDAVGNRFDPIKWEAASSFHHKAFELAKTGATRYGDEAALKQGF